MEVNNSAQPANLQELTLESGVCYWWNFGLMDQRSACNIFEDAVGSVLR